MNIETLIATYPRLYHMAEQGSWRTIEAHGLWSTAALLDFHRIAGAEREAYESRHRREKVPLTSQYFPDTVLRDQKPMSDASLTNCLQGGLTPRNWYELLNSKTFFWATYDRLLTLLNARPYRNDDHDVLTIDTASLVTSYEQTISLCHMNSGSSIPWRVPRDVNIFSSIQNYPAKRNGNPRKPVVELVVEYGVSDIANHVISVQRMRGGEILETIR